MKDERICNASNDELMQWATGGIPYLSDFSVDCVKEMARRYDIVFDKTDGLQTEETCAVDALIRITKWLDRGRTSIKLRGLKKAVQDYRTIDTRPYREEDIYPMMMLNTVSGEIWTDQWTSDCHNYYDDPDVVCLNIGDIKVGMRSIQKRVNDIYGGDETV